MINSIENTLCSGIDKYSGSFDQDPTGVTLIPTDTIKLLNDFTLLGLFTFLASCSSDWKINAKHLASHFDCGKDKIYKAIDALIDLGLLTRTIIRDKGKFVRYHYRLHLRQTDKSLPFPKNPDTVQSDTEKPFPEKPEPVNKDAYKTENIKNKNNNNIYISEKINFEEYKQEETKVLTEQVEQSKKEHYKKDAIQHKKCIEAFKTLWKGLEVTIEEAYDTCQEYWEIKNEIANWGRFINFLKNPNSRKAFEPIMDTQRLKKEAIEREEQEQRRKQQEIMGSKQIMNEIKKKMPANFLKTTLGWT